MRLTPLRLAFLFCAALFLLGPAAALTQQPGGRGKGKGGGGDNTQPGGDNGGMRVRGGGAGGGPGGGGPGGGMNFDPTQMAQQFAQQRFAQLANGKDVIVIADLPTQGNQRDPNPQATMQAWATTQGITNGQITLDQYTAYMKERMTQMQAGGGAGGRNGPGGGGGMRGNTQPRDYDKEAEASFRRYDREGNGLLTVDTMSPELRDEWEKWDANNDGAIDLAEYKAYYKARMAFLNPGQDGNGNRDPRNRDNPDNQFDPAQEEEKRPTVYRVGHMPRELPPWFEQLDTDRDGQVGLYEWKAGGRNIVEFLAIDKNGDGFLTVEEVLRWQKNEIAKKKERDQTTVALGSEDDPDGMPSELPRTIGAPGSYSGRNNRAPGGNFTPRGNNGGNDAAANPWAPNAGGNNGGQGRGNRGGAPGGGGPGGGGGGPGGGGRGNRGGGGGGGGR